MKKKTVPVVLLIILILTLGCKNNAHKSVSQNSFEPVVPLVDDITIYNGGLSKKVDVGNPNYYLLLKEIQVVLLKSEFASGDMYRLGVPNGDISRYKAEVGVELIYSKPILLSLGGRSHLVYRMFFHCDSSKPKLFLGIKNSDFYNNGPYKINDTSKLNQFIKSMFQS